MSFYVIGEPIYKTSNWYRNIMDGLNNEKRQKRFALTLLESIDELKDVSICQEDAIFVIAANGEWLAKIIQVCESVFHNRIVVLGNHENRLCKGQYSVVTADLAYNIRLLYNYLVSYGKQKIAMYGINPVSTSDTFRKESFLSCGAAEKDVFYNTFSLSQCFEDFLQKIDDYDAVICANDYAAISLVKYLGEERHIYIASCGGSTLLSNFFSPSITHTWNDYQSFGKAGLDLCRILLKNNTVNSVNIYLSSNFSAGETTDCLPLVEESVPKIHSVHKGYDNFYSDSEIDEMMRIETLLNSCDKDDFLLLELLLKQMTYAQIAEELFMSTNGVKYKLKNMFQVCRVTTRNDFVQLLNKYLNNN